jgi:hypothetical protein
VLPLLLLLLLLLLLVTAPPLPPLLLLLGTVVWASVCTASLTDGPRSSCCRKALWLGGM